MTTLGYHGLAPMITPISIQPPLKRKQLTGRSISKNDAVRLASYLVGHKLPLDTTWVPALFLFFFREACLAVLFQCRDFRNFLGTEVNKTSRERGGGTFFSRLNGDVPGRAGAERWSMVFRGFVLNGVFHHFLY